MSWADEYYRGRLDRWGRDAYDRVRTAWEKKRRQVNLGMSAPASEELKSVVCSVAMDHPELFWPNYYRFSILSIPLSTTLSFSFFFDITSLEVLAHEADDWARSVVAQLPPSFGRDEWAWLLFDYLARQVSYGKRLDIYSQTIMGVMRPHDHVAVCEGIAKAYKFLCDAARIPCIIVVGTASSESTPSVPHAWNVISYAGRCRHVDVTAELQIAHAFGKARRRCDFVRTDAEMTGYEWDCTQIPHCV